VTSYDVNTTLTPPSALGRASCSRAVSAATNASTSAADAADAARSASVHSSRSAAKHLSRSTATVRPSANLLAHLSSSAQSSSRPHNKRKGPRNNRGGPDDPDDPADTHSAQALSSAVIALQELEPGLDPRALAQQKLRLIESQISLAQAKVERAQMLFSAESLHMEMLLRDQEDCAAFLDTAIATHASVARSLAVARSDHLDGTSRFSPQVAVSLPPSASMLGSIATSFTGSSMGFPALVRPTLLRALFV
jgi:hypothetical protein